jgi:hypothetical protein
MAAIDKHGLGVLKPVDHVVISFASAQQADAATLALAALGLRGPHTVRRLSDREMLQQIDADLRRASPVTAIGQELNLAMAHRALAERGYHWLVVYAPDDRQVSRVTQVAHNHGAEHAQRYGNFIIDELIVRRFDQGVLAQAHDESLDARTALWRRMRAH